VALTILGHFLGHIGHLLTHLDLFPAFPVVFASGVSAFRGLPGLRSDTSFGPRVEPGRLSLQDKFITSLSARLRLNRLLDRLAEVLHKQLFRPLHPFLCYYH
jgi:hypothetical protein